MPHRRNRKDESLRQDVGLGRLDAKIYGNFHRSIQSTPGNFRYNSSYSSIRWSNTIARPNRIRQARVTRASAVETRRATGRRTFKFSAIRARAPRIATAATERRHGLRRHDARTTRCGGSRRESKSNGALRRWDAVRQRPRTDRGRTTGARPETPPGPARSNRKRPGLMAVPRKSTVRAGASDHLAAPQYLSILRPVLDESDGFCPSEDAS